MQKLLKLARDVRPQDQPEGTYVFGKNGIQNYIKGSVINEPGFQVSAATIPYVPIGIIETDKFPIIFSTNNVNSAFGYFDSVNDTYISIVNDISLGFKLGFSTNRPITGQSQRNYKGEIIAAFTDGTLNPFCVNCDFPNTTSLKSMRFFPLATPPVLTVSNQTGGSLLPGAYFAAIKYLRTDGTETGFLVTSSPVIVRGTVGQITDQAFQVLITDVDLTYQQIQVAIISKVAGVTKAVLLDPVPLVENANILFTGAELTANITLEEILVPPAVYEKVQAFGQLNDALYLGNVSTAPALNMQKYANLINLRWSSELISVIPQDAAMASGTKKTFMHQEVYAWYIRYKLANGTASPAFTIPGPALLTSQRNTSTLATAEGQTSKVFQVEDTITVFDPITRTGYMGKWENDTEVYPNTADYDSTDIGGPNLRGQKVRHHRFPSIAWCKENLYSSNTEYGRTKLDRLGIRAENVIIPSQYADQIIGYELLYAKRTPGNSTVVGQALYLFGARATADTALNKRMSTGGNWGSKIYFKTNDGAPLQAEQSIFHFHSFDMLFNKPSTSPDYLSFQLKHRATNIQNDGYMENGEVFTGNDGPLVYQIDYIQKGQSPTVPSIRLKAVKDTQYVPNDTLIGKWFNKGIETFFGGSLSNPATLIPSGEISQQNVFPSSRKSYTPNEFAVKQESTFLCNLLAVNPNLFVSFTGQTLVRAGTVVKLSATNFMFGGDTYICDYSFHTYGHWNTSEDFVDTQDYFKGTKTVRRFICESAANLYARNEVVGNTYSRYYPKSALVPNDQANYLTLFKRNFDPNQFGYSKELNALDEFISSQIFNTYQENVTEYPYRIHRSGKMQKQTKARSWQTLLPLDYYEAQKNMGAIKWLEGMEDRLLIHHENALFLTQDKTKLESDILSITLGSGDIFQFQPQEALGTKLGYAGTQHNLACVRTPMGYVFIDSKTGQLFIYKGGLELMNGMLNVFLQQYLKLKENNPYLGNGFTIGYDPQYKRILITAKNLHLADTSVVNIPVYTPSLLPTLAVNTVVRKDGRLQRYLGVNVAPGYDCPPTVTPSANNIVVTKPEDTPINSLITTALGVNVDDFYILTAQSTFALEATSGKLLLKAPLSFASTPYILSCKGINKANNTEALFTITVNVTAVVRPPKINDNEATIPERSPVNTPVCSMVGSGTGSLSYSIIDGNTGTAFKINSSGNISVNDSSTLTVALNPVYYLTVRITDSVGTADAIVKITLLPVRLPPTKSNMTFNVVNTIPIGTTIVALDPSTADSINQYSYAIIGSTEPTAFEIDADFNIKTLTLLNPTKVYVLNVQMSDDSYNSVDFTVTVNVLYDEAILAFAPSEGSCLPATPTCASGFVLSDDATKCTKVTTVAADAIGGGAAIALAHFSYAQYAYWGTIIYPIGTYGSNGAVSTKPNSTLVHTTAPIFGYKPGGEASVINTLWNNTTSGTAQDGSTGRLNRTGVWKQGNVNYVGMLGFSRQFNVPAAGNYLIGVGADDAATIKINGVTIVAQDLTAINTSFNSVYAAGVAGSADLFRYWHVYQVTLNAGSNIISVTGNNTGGVGVIGAEIYNCTIAQLIAATTEATLAPYIVFSSAARTYGTIDNGDPSDVGSFDCSSNPTYTLVYDPIALTYSCRLIATATPTPGSSTTKKWNKVTVTDTAHNVLLQTFLNDVTAKNFQGIPVPYYANVVNHIDCGGTLTLYLNSAQAVEKTKNDCAVGLTGSKVRYAKAAGLFVSTTSQAAADALRDADITANAQSNANTNGSCS